MVDERGRWLDDEAKVGDIAIDYFEKLFTSSSPEDFSDILSAIQPKVTTTMNEELTRTFTAQEIKVALKQMYPLKTPGPNSMPPIFFQHF